MIANLEPLWAQPDPLMTELTLPRVGADRGARQYQIASLLRSGARVSFGSDWPVTAYRPARHRHRGDPADPRRAPRQRLAARRAGHRRPGAGRLLRRRRLPGVRGAPLGPAAPRHARQPRPPRRRPGRHPRPRAARPARAGHLARRNPHLLTKLPTPATIPLGAVPCPNPPPAPPSASSTARSAPARSCSSSSPPPRR